MSATNAKNVTQETGGPNLGGSAHPSATNSAVEPLLRVENVSKQFPGNAGAR